MAPIKTVSTLERIIRNSILTIMVLVFAGLSFRDGYVAYPAKNLVEAKKELPPELQDQAVINPKVLWETVATLESGISIKDIESQLGPACCTVDSTKRVRKSIWFGPGGLLVVFHNKADVVIKKPEWRKGPKTETDLLIQKIMGVVLAPFGLYLLIRVIIMMTCGATLSDAGLKTTGRRLIPFDAMKGWDTTDYKKKGRIVLAYSLGGQDGAYVLDDYKLRAFRPIVKEICERRGFENPIDKKGPEDSEADVTEKPASAD